MNLKSYSRGIGAGLIVAALVLGLGSKPEKMSDSDVKKRAAELGMIESSTLMEMNNEIASTEASASISEEDRMEDVTDETEGNTEETKDDVSGAEFVEPDKETVPPVNVPISLPELEDNEILPPAINPLPEDESGYTEVADGVEIVVIRGDSSVSVARRMFEAGLVESAVEFDKFLCSNGYDKVISVGTYTIPYGLTFEEMADILTRKN